MGAVKTTDARDYSTPNEVHRRPQVPILTGSRSKKKLNYPKANCPYCYLIDRITRKLYPRKKLSEGKNCYFSHSAREEFYCKCCEREVIMRTDYSGVVSTSWYFSPEMLED